MDFTSGGREQGQVIPALLATVFAVLLLALLLAQVGSAAEQKTRARSVADAAAVAATQSLRDNMISVRSRSLPRAWAVAVFGVARPVPLRAQGAACGAAQRNWSANPHHSPLDCSALSVSVLGDGVRVTVNTPRGEVFDGGAADTSGIESRAFSRTRIVLARCPAGVGVRTALARWIVDESARAHGVMSRCFTPDDELSLRPFDLNPHAAPAAVGSPQPILTAARNSFRVEIIE